MVSTPLKDTLVSGSEQTWPVASLNPAPIQLADRQLDHAGASSGLAPRRLSCPHSDPTKDAFVGHRSTGRPRSGARRCFNHTGRNLNVLWGRGRSEYAGPHDPRLCERAAVRGVSGVLATLVEPTGKATVDAGSTPAASIHDQGGQRCSE